MSKDTKNTKLWKLLEERDNREAHYNDGLPASVIDVVLERNDKTDSEIDELLRD